MLRGNGIGPQRKLKRLIPIPAQSGFDKHYARSTIRDNEEHIKAALFRIHGHLFEFSQCFIAQQWKAKFICYLEKQTIGQPTVSPTGAFILTTTTGRPTERSFARVASNPLISNPDRIKRSPMPMNLNQTDQPDRSGFVGPRHSTSSRRKNLESTLSQRRTVIEWIQSDGVFAGQRELQLKTSKSLETIKKTTQKRQVGGK